MEVLQVFMSACGNFGNFAVISGGLWKFCMYFCEV